MSIKHNVSFNVYDEITGKLVQHHEGHNAATNSMLQGIAHYLLGDGVLNQGTDLLEQWIPRYISLGTMGLYNQEVDAEGLPTGIGYSSSADEETNFKYYMDHTPGFGADGYDPFENPDSDKGFTRPYFGLGPIFADRNAEKIIETLTGISGKLVFRVQYKIKELNYVKVDGIDRTAAVRIGNDRDRIRFSAPAPRQDAVIEVSYTTVQVANRPTTNCELISDTFPRAPISYRKIVPEEYAELPKTIDIVFSAMISTGAMKQFREEGKDYVLVTEAGLWSRKNWPTNDDGNINYNSGDNGLLAGYRIYPPDDSQQDMSNPENRRILKEQILRVGYNQVVQVVWKIQLGSVGELVNYIKEPIIWKGFSES